MWGAIFQDARRIPPDSLCEASGRDMTGAFAKEAHFQQYARNQRFVPLPGSSNFNTSQLRIVRES
jgi:hypothetical protein